MKIYEEQKTMVFTPSEFGAVGAYLAEHANDLSGWTVTVDTSYGFAQRVADVLTSEEIRLRLSGN